MNDKKGLETIIEQYRKCEERIMMTYGIKEMCEFFLGLENSQPKQQVDKAEKIESLHGKIYGESGDRSFSYSILDIANKLNEVIEALNKQNGF